MNLVSVVAVCAGDGPAAWVKLSKHILRATTTASALDHIFERASTLLPQPTIRDLVNKLDELLGDYHYAGISNPTDTERLHMLLSERIPLWLPRELALQFTAHTGTYPSAQAKWDACLNELARLATAEDMLNFNTPAIPPAVEVFSVDAKRRRLDSPRCEYCKKLHPTESCVWLLADMVAGVAPLRDWVCPPSLEGQTGDATSLFGPRPEL